MNDILDDHFAVCAAATGLTGYCLAHFPTLKRGANHRCAYGAIEIGTSLVNEVGAPVWPTKSETAWSTKWIHVIAPWCEIHAVGFRALPCIMGCTVQTAERDS